MSDIIEEMGGYMGDGSEFVEFVDRALDENGNYPGEAEAELDAFINSLEGRLAGFTTEELVIEVNDRTLRALKGLTEANERLARHLGLEKAPF